MVELAVKGESMAVGMCAATFKRVRGAAGITVEGESMAVGMRTATIKKVHGAARPVIKGESTAVGMHALRHVRTHLLWRNCGCEHGNMELTGKATLGVFKWLDTLPKWFQEQCWRFKIYGFDLCLIWPY